MTDLPENTMTQEQAAEALERHDERKQEQSRTIVGGQMPKRNEPCPCGSKLKFKHCHGDSAKQQAVQEVIEQANARMWKHLIIMELMKKGKLPYPFTCTKCGKGTVEPKQSQMSPDTLLCPECGGLVEKTKSELETVDE